MYIHIPTIDLWHFPDAFTPEKLLRQLRILLLDGDIIAFGSYSPSPRLLHGMESLGATQTDAGTIYGESFSANRGEYPDGRPFEVVVCSRSLQTLTGMASWMGGQTDKPLFFDHLIGYRRGFPVVPLVDFHDAFNGGRLFASELYAESAVQAFTAGLPSACLRVRHPALP